MDFGKFIGARRSALGLNHQTCAARSGLEISTLSRVENSQGRPTLQTAVRVCRGLEVSLADLLDWWQGSHAVLLEEAPLLPIAEVLTRDDVEAFVRCFRAKPLLCATWLTDSLNGLLAGKGWQLSLFAPVDVVKLLFSDSPLYRFEILYPAELAPEKLLALNRSGGMLTFRDVGHYLERTRSAKGRTIGHIASGLGIGPSILSRIENGDHEQIKLAYVLALDQSLEQGGKLLMLYWGAENARRDIELHLSEQREAPWSVYEERLAEVLVRVCRWASLEDPGYAQQRFQVLRLLEQHLEPAESSAFPTVWLRAQLNYQLPSPAPAHETGDSQVGAQPAAAEGRQHSEENGERLALENVATVLRERNRELGRILQEARQQKDLSLAACADQIGTTQERYAALEAGEAPIGAAELEVLVRFLGIPARQVWP
jgi:transcriptional regulator with XRE-family HTH domain